MPDITVEDLIANFRFVLEAIPETVKDAIFSNEKQIIRLNQNQLYDGKTNTGEDIHPLYTEDPFFKTVGQAQGYIKWKQKITPNSRRNPNAPNLFINGYYHRSLKLVDENGDVIIISTLTGEMGGIDEKYANILGLTPSNQEIINNEIILPKIWDLLEKYR